MTTLTKGLRNSVTELIAICDQQITQWETTRTQLKMLASINGNGHAQVAQVEAMAEAALQTHRTKRKYERRQPRNGAQSKSKPLPQVDVPEGLQLHDVPLKEAVISTLKAAKKGLSVKETTAMMIGAGFNQKFNQPPARAVGVQMGIMAKKKKLKKSPTGFYSLRG